MLVMAIVGRKTADWPYVAIFYTAAVALCVAVASVRIVSCWLLGSFVWLGTWLKFVEHIYIPGVIVEATGKFSRSTAQYNEVCVVAAVGLFGIAAAIFAFSLVKWARSSKYQTISRKTASKGVVEWSLALLLLIIAAILNAFIGINRAGLSPDHILPIKLNGAVSEFLIVGYFFAFAFVWSRESRSVRSYLTAIGVISIANAISSISILSRGAIVFSQIAVIVAIWKCSKHLGRKRIALTAIATVLSLIFIVFTTYIVNDQRAAKFSGEDVKVSFVGNLSVIAQLSSARWIGLEGIMTAVGADNKSVELLWKLMTERPSLTATGLYQYIARSPYISIDRSKYQFATLPGPIGVFALGGSLPLVFILVGSLSALAFLAEWITDRTTQNCFASSFVGVSAANTVAQFGVVPDNLLPYFLAFALCIGVLSVFSRGGQGQSFPEFRT